MLPETFDVFGVVGRVMVVLIEGSGVVELYGHAIDFHFDAEHFERGHVFGVEIGDGARVEAHGVQAAGTGSHPQLVRD